MAEPITKINTVDFERNCIEIDGEKYEIAHPDEFSLEEQIKLSQMGKKLKNMADISTTEIDQVSKAFERVFKRVLLAPEEVIKKLREGHKMAIVDAVFSQEGWLKKSRKNSEGSQPSSDSMAAIQ